MDELSIKSTHILDTWITLEILEAGGKFNKPEELVENTSRKILPLSSLPWENDRGVPDPDKNEFYEIFLGTIKLDAAYQNIFNRYEDSRPDMPSTKKYCPIATILVDSQGVVQTEQNVNVSSFCWAYSHVISKDISSLSNWSSEKKKITSTIYSVLYRNQESVTLSTLDNAYTTLCNELKLSKDLCESPSVMVHIPTSKTTQNPETTLLNSFYLDDLVLTQTLIQRKEQPQIINWYLGASKTDSKINILEDSDALEQSLAPKKFPDSRWPGPGRHPLVTLQQTAVNLSRTVADGEILAINGPPGTGKTTLLRDVIASVVEQRASVMAEYDDPAMAFQKSGVKTPFPAYTVESYSVSPRLRGFEILIASSNNKAVENVSKEFPCTKAIATDIEGLKYFKTVSDKILGEDTWGMIAAVMGKSSNRKEFKDNFWFDDDTGMQVFLKFICGQKKETKEGKTPKIVIAEHAPLNHDEAVINWKKIKAKYLDQKQKVHDLITKREEYRKLTKTLPILISLLQKRAQLSLKRPCILKRLLRTASYRKWKKLDDYICSKFETLEKIDNLALFSSEYYQVKSYMQKRKFFLSNKYPCVISELNEMQKKMMITREEKGFSIITSKLLNTNKDEAQLIAPWFSKEEQKLRDELFRDSILLHQYFIAAAAEPLKINIMCALRLLDGEECIGLNNSIVQDVITSLFMVVPCISTTFASVSTMLRSTPKESIGWLIVDEAGQAKPQEAIGALVRCKRAMVVGDPIQIPPVVSMPENLVNSIATFLGVDTIAYCAPAASVQSLSDDANLYMANFRTTESIRSVGLPLLVHRRCSEPMFSIANRIAYDDQMVNAKSNKPSKIKDKLGPSRWIHIEGKGQDKWCYNEGLYVLEQCEELVRAKIELDLYIVSPFVKVVREMRSLFRKNNILQESIPEFDEWTNKRIGTVHTVQGREADTVFFVLGAPYPDQYGARKWAGQSPNLLNVAVTRAKECLYIVGNRELWKTAGLFRDVISILDQMARN